MDNDQYFDLKMQYGLQQLIGELESCFTQSRWLSAMEQFDLNNKTLEKNKEYVPHYLKSQHARTFMLKIQEVIKEHLKVQIQIQYIYIINYQKEIDECIKKTNIKKQLDLLQSSQIARSCLQQADIPGDFRDMLFQDQISIDDIVEDGILTILKNKQLKD